MYEEDFTIITAVEILKDIYIYILRYVGQQLFILLKLLARLYMIYTKYLLNIANIQINEKY